MGKNETKRKVLFSTILTTVAKETAFLAQPVSPASFTYSWGFENKEIKEEGKDERE